MSKSRRYYGLVVCSSYLTLGSPASRRLADIVTFPGLQEVVGVNSGGKSSVSRVKKGALWAARNRDDFRMAGFSDATAAAAGGVCLLRIPSAQRGERSVR